MHAAALHLILSSFRTEDSSGCPDPLSVLRFPCGSRKHPRQKSKGHSANLVDRSFARQLSFNRPVAACVSRSKVNGGELLFCLFFLAPRRPL